MPLGILSELIPLEPLYDSGRNEEPHYRLRPESPDDPPLLRYDDRSNITVVNLRSALPFTHWSGSGARAVLKCLVDCLSGGQFDTMYVRKK